MVPRRGCADRFGSLATRGIPLQRLVLFGCFMSTSYRPGLLQINEGFVVEDLEANQQRDKFERLSSADRAVNLLIEELKPSAPDF
jgi:hypothetical protein